MALETKLNLNDSTIAHLQTLIQINSDSVAGLRQASEEVQDANISGLFSELSEQRMGFADELKSFVELNGKQPNESGTVMGAVHRFWLDMRSKLNGGDAYVILCEAERGEDYIKHAYEEAVTATTGNPVNDVLSRQYAVLKAGHDRIRDLRDMYQNS